MLAFNKDAKILALDRVVLTHYVMFIIINQFAPVLMDMKEILTLVVMFAKVSEILQVLGIIFLVFVYVCFHIFLNFV